MAEELTSEELVQCLHLCDCDNVAFERLYQYMMPKIVTHLRSRFVCYQDCAEDIAHDFFANIRAKSPKNDILFPIAYIFKSCGRIYTSKYARYGQSVELTEDMYWSNPDYVQNISTELYGLPYSSWNVLYMTYFLGYSMQEFAEKVGISYAAARKRRSRAIQHLRKQLGVEIPPAKIRQMLDEEDEE